MVACRCAYSWRSRLRLRHTMRRWLGATRLGTELADDLPQVSWDRSMHDFGNQRRVLKVVCRRELLSLSPECCASRPLKVLQRMINNALCGRFPHRVVGPVRIFKGLGHCLFAKLHSSCLLHLLEHEFE